MTIAPARRLSQPPSDPDFFQNPYPVYAAIRARSPLFYWEDYGFWCASGYDDVSALLRDRRFGREVLHVATRSELGWPEIPDHVKPFYDFDSHSILEREPPIHTRLRGLINRAFVSRQVERLRPRVSHLAHQLVDEIEGRGAVDLIAGFATAIPVVVITEMLGIPLDMAPQLLGWSHRMVAMYQFRPDRETELDAVAATAAFAAYMTSVVDARRAAPGDDLVSLLVAARDDQDRLSEAELVTTCVLLLNAGHEATVHAIGNGVNALLLARERGGFDPAAAFASAASTELAVEELLRFDAPLHMFTRYALEPVEFGGVNFRKGDKVGLLLGAANRDPARYPDPDRLRLDRVGPTNLSFGAGIHFCVGAPLARVELQAALPVLFQRLPGLCLAEPARYRDTFHFHGLERLMVSG